jgi:hypothetical protein
LFHPFIYKQPNFIPFYVWIIHVHTLYGWIYQIFLFWSSVIGHLSYFQSLGIVNNASINMGVQVPLLYPVCLPCVICPEVVSLDHMVGLFLVFWETSILLSIVLIRNYSPINSVWGFLLSPHPHQHLLFVLLMIAILTGMRWNLNVILASISFMTEDVDQYSLAMCTSSFESYLFSSFVHLFIGFWRGWVFELPV